MSKSQRFLLPVLLFVFSISLQATEIELSKKDLETRWAARIHHLLAKGKLPLIGMETSLQEEQVEESITEILPALDEYGIAFKNTWYLLTGRSWEK